MWTQKKLMEVCVPVMTGVSQTKSQSPGERIATLKYSGYLSTKYTMYKQVLSLWVCIQSARILHSLGNCLPWSIPNHNHLK